MNESLHVEHDEANHQFHLSVYGQRAYLAYMDLGKQTMDFYRTFVPDAPVSYTHLTLPTICSV